MPGARGSSVVVGVLRWKETRDEARRKKPQGFDEIELEHARIRRERDNLRLSGERSELVEIAAVEAEFVLRIWEITTTLDGLAHNLTARLASARIRGTWPSSFEPRSGPFGSATCGDCRRSLFQSRARRKRLWRQLAEPTDRCGALFDRHLRVVLHDRRHATVIGDRHCDLDTRPVLSQAVEDNATQIVEREAIQAGPRDGGAESASYPSLPEDEHVRSALLAPRLERLH